MKRRRKSPLSRPPRPLVTYITLAEVEAKAAALPRGQQLVVPFDMLAPADKKRVAESLMHGFDDLPRKVRDAINAAQRISGHLPLAVKMVASGQSEEQIVRVIIYNDALLAARYP